MIEQFVRTLLQPLYNAMGFLVPISIFFVSGIIIFVLVSQVKMHIGKKGNHENIDTFVPYMTKEDIDYVFTGKKI